MRGKIQKWTRVATEIAPLWLAGIGLLDPVDVRAEGRDSSSAAEVDSLSLRAIPAAKYFLPEVLVIDSYERSLAATRSASQGTLRGEALALRPVRRAGEVLEAVPGVVISQHSGEGKANQYYLRGFNLDHGTDLALRVAGVPVNMPTHGHGQGYADLNFVIPEMVSGIQYRKGTYFAEEGDFASAGAAHFAYRNRFEAPMVKLTGGQNQFQRAFLGASPQVGGGTLLGALELYRNDGPWVHPDKYRRVNGIARWSAGTQTEGFSLSAMGYKGDWNSTDQVPRRAIERGAISRFGAIDRSDGGSSKRFSLSGEYQRLSADAHTKANAYLLDYEMHLFSNFTYFLDDPINGDQFEQADDRTTFGLGASHLRSDRWFGRSVQTTIGFDARNDQIHQVGLYHTVARRRLETIRQDQVAQRSVSPYVQSEWQWAPGLRTLFGLRGELYHFDVEAEREENSGTRDAAMLSPKASLMLGPWNESEIYLNFGQGFHSNDARGSTITVDPSSGEPAERVTPLARATGTEVAVRSGVIDRLNASVSIWNLDLESELLFIGDAGTTEASRPSRRTGVEITGVYTIGSRLSVDGSFAYSRARFRDDDPAGDHIPGAVEGVLAGGISYDAPAGLFGSARLRYFGPRPLIEDDSRRSESSTLVSGELGHRFARGYALVLEGFNLLDSDSSDIDYFYESRLRDEPEDSAIPDIHTHPVEPRMFRLSVQANWN